MPAREVVAVEHKNVQGTHMHVRAVRIAGDFDFVDQTQDSLASLVIEDMRAQGTRYFTVGVASGEESDIVIVKCPECGEDRIVTYPANPEDDDLDSFTEFGGEEAPRRFGPKIR
jgi:hypothetical protein